MSDLIDRQAAIDAMKDMCRAAEKWLRDATDDVTKARAESCMASLVEIKLRTEKLPSVQSDHVADISKKVEGDCISRKEALKICRRYWNPTFNPIMEEIEKLPSAQPEPHWIPCSERLPDDLAEVNVTWVNHEPEPYYESIKSKPFTASAVYYEGKWYWYSSVCADVLAEYGRNDVDKVDDTIEITAWRPLPKAYLGGDE